MGWIMSRAVEVNREQAVSSLPCSSATTVIINKNIAGSALCLSINGLECLASIWFNSLTPQNKGGFVYVFHLWNVLCPKPRMAPLLENISCCEPYIYQ